MARRKNQNEQMYSIFFNGNRVCVVGAKDGVEALDLYFQMNCRKNPESIAVSMKLTNGAIVQAVRTG